MKPVPVLKAAAIAGDDSNDGPKTILIMDRERPLIAASLKRMRWKKADTQLY